MTARALVALVGLTAGCGSDDDGTGSGDAGAGADPAGSDAGQLDWESVDVLFEDGSNITERVTYRSGGLLIDGQVCRRQGGGPWIGSSYRGEDASEGDIEVCQIEAGTGPTATYQMLIDIVETATGGTPDEVPDAYMERSPALFALPDEVPFLITHGTVDELVPVQQSCALVAATTGFIDYHLNGSQSEVTSAPAGCEAQDLAWSAGPRPTADWPDARYLIVYDGLGHGFGGAAGTAMIGDVVGFLMAKLPP